MYQFDVELVFKFLSSEWRVDLYNYYILFILCVACMCMYEGACAIACMQKSEETFQESVQLLHFLAIVLNSGYLAKQQAPPTDLSGLSALMN